MNKVAAFALRRKNSILSMSEKMFCPPQPLRFWITPAYAGKRHHPEPGQSSSEDHPRVCGEKCWILSSNTPLMGSPPRMRGKAFGLVLYKVEIGITSACAGKSVRTCAVQSRDRDHPRMCGEKHGIAILTTCTLGSPPPVRGKDNRQGDQLADPWITPACAGKRSRCRMNCC